jgi:glycosyltransferase involved in cell wall biosynthesis
MEPVRVAFDVSALNLQPRSGITFAVESLHGALDQRDDVELIDFVVGLHGRPGARRVPVPVDWALRCWSRWPHPDARWWLRGASVVHGTFFGAPPTGKPTVVSIHDTWFLRHTASVSHRTRMAGESLTRAVRGGATVHVSSQATAAHAAELLPGATVEVIPLGPLGVPPAPDRSPIQPVGGRPFVVAIGNLEQRKNLPALIEAFAAVAAEEHEPLLVLAGGDGDDVPAIEAAIDGAGSAIAARILRAGPIDATARAWLLRHAAVLALPSLDEGFGLALLDAMEVDLPVVASTAGAIVEVAGDAALLCDPHDVAALAEHLRLALTDDVTRRRLVTNGRRQLARFSWDTTAERMSQLYQRLATDGS